MEKNLSHLLSDFSTFLSHITNHQRVELFFLSLMYENKSKKKLMTKRYVELNQKPGTLLALLTKEKLSFGGLCLNFAFPDSIQQPKLTKRTIQLKEFNPKRNNIHNSCNKKN